MSKTLLACSQCGIMCKNELELNQHITVNHNGRGMKAEKYNEKQNLKQYSPADKLAVNVKDSHNLPGEEVGPIVCPACGKECKNERGLKTHQRTHKDKINADDHQNLKELKGILQAEVKMEKTDLKVALEVDNEMENVHGVQNVVCSVCGKRCKNERGLKVHQRSHQNDKETRVNDLQQNQEESEKICGDHKVIKCNDIALKKDVMPDKEVNELRKCQEIAVCPVCGKECKNDKGLKIHLRIHKDDTKKFEGNNENLEHATGSNELVSSALGLSHKQVIYIQNSSKICTVCDKKCKNEQELKIHQATHINDRDAVDKMNKKHTTLQNKANTLQSGKPKNAIVCRICNNTFRTLKGFRIHTTRVHNYSSDEEDSCSSSSEDEEDEKEENIAAQKIKGNIAHGSDKLGIRTQDWRNFGNEMEQKMTNLRSQINGNLGNSFITWTVMKSGSHVEITKIGRPDEFDVMFTCTIRDLIVKPSKFSGFYRLLWPKKPPTDLEFLTSHLVGKCYLDPKLFKVYFSSLVENSDLPRSKLKIDPDQPQSMPGLRLVGTVYNYNDSRSRMKETCSVDLIPAIEFDGWLCDGRTDRPQWIPADIWADALQRHHLVPKIHCSEQEKPAGQCTLWRASFSYAEKKIMRAADSSISTRQGTKTKTYRKILVKQLKTDLESWKNKENNSKVIPDITSYVIKTASFHLFELHSKNSDWTKDNYMQRYDDALNYLKGIFRVKRGMSPVLDNYFLPKCNILEKLSTKPDCAEQCNYVQDCIDEILSERE